jgi:hypothetical protein
LSAADDKLTDGGGGACTVKLAPRVVPLREAETVTDFVTETASVFTVKPALDDPAGTVTLEDTVAADVSLLERVTTMPPDGAAPLSVTVPCEGDPPVTDVGLRDMPVKVGGGGGWTVSDADLLTPPSEAVMLTVVEIVTGTVVTVNEAVVVPAATVMPAGTVATLVLLLVSATTAPPDGAAEEMTTVP